MKKLTLLVLTALIISSCSDNTPTTPNKDSEPTPDLKANPLVAIPATSTAGIGSSSLILESQPDETPFHTFRLDTFRISSYEVMNHEFSKALEQWVASFPQWDTISTGDTITVLSGAMRNDSDTVSIILGDSSREIVLLNKAALTFIHDTTSDSTNGKVVRRIKPSLLVLESYRNYPVQGVSWYGAALFCWIKSKDSLLDYCFDTAGLAFTIDTSKNGYRMPTEAEWEWVARDGKAGYNAFYPTGSSISPDRARYLAFSATVTGANAPNSNGIYDLAGNLWEWCIDSYSSVFYNTAAATGNNPVNLDFSTGKRVMRGGGFQDQAPSLRTSKRSGVAPEYMGIDAGFRIVRK